MIRWIERDGKQVLQCKENEIDVWEDVPLVQEPKSEKLKDIIHENSVGQYAYQDVAKAAIDYVEKVSKDFSLLDSVLSSEYVGIIKFINYLRNKAL